MEQYKKSFSFRAPTLASCVNYLAISPDGRLLAVCSDDHCVHVVSIRSHGRVYKRISTHLGPMSTAQWAANREGGFWLFTAGHRGVVCSYRVRLSSASIGDDEIIVEQDVAAPVTLADEEIVDMALDTFAQNLAVVCASHVYMFGVNVSSSSPLTRQSQYPPEDDHDKKAATASAAAFCTDEGGVPMLVVAYVDSGTLRAFRVKSWSMIWERYTGFQPVTLAWVPERRYLLAFCIEFLDVKVLELLDNDLVQHLKLTFNRPNTHRYRRVVCSAEQGRYALCGSDEGLLVGWDLSSGEQSSTTLDHGRGEMGLGEMGLKETRPGLQAITSRSAFVASRYTNMIAGATHSTFPVVMLWEMDKYQTAGRYRWLGHIRIAFDIVCLLFAFCVLYYCKCFGGGLLSPSYSNGIPDIVQKVVGRVSGNAGRS